MAAVEGLIAEVVDSYDATYAVALRSPTASAASEGRSGVPCDGAGGWRSTRGGGVGAARLLIDEEAGPRCPISLLDEMPRNASTVSSMMPPRVIPARCAARGPGFAATKAEQRFRVIRTHC